MTFMMNRSTLLAALLSIGLPASNCFSSNSFSLEIKANRALNAQSTNSREGGISRSFFLASSAALLIQTPALISNALTDDEASGTTVTPSDTTATPNDTITTTSDTPATPVVEVVEPLATRRTIEGCPKPISGKPNNCVATANIKQLDTYIPPWTFEVSPDEAFSLLKRLIIADPTFIVAESDESSLYLKVDIKRNFNTQDVMELLVKRDDKVVILNSYQSDGPSISDFGANKKRLDDLLLKSSGVFSVMGGGLTADSYEGGAGGKRNGAFGQLKAFYGLQSGQGFQEVIQE